VNFVCIAQYFNGRKGYVPFWTETWKRNVLCLLLTKRICDREINYEVCWTSSFLFVCCHCVVLLCLYHYSKVLLCKILTTVPWNGCVIKLSNLLLAVTPSETCCDVTDMSMQLKMRKIRNEGVFLCNCKIIKFDLKISISSINPSRLHLKQICIINIPIFWELI